MNHTLGGLDDCPPGRRKQRRAARHSRPYGRPVRGRASRPLLRAVDETAPLYGPHRQKRTSSSTHSNEFVRRRSRQPPSLIEIAPPPCSGRLVLTVKTRCAELNRSAHVSLDRPG